MDAPLRDLAGSIRGAVATDPEARARAGRDRSHLVGAPIAVVHPRDAEDVATLVAWARRHRIPVVARGGGTSLDGESVPIRGGVVIDLSAWRAVREIRPDEGWARVEPGVVNLDLQAALAKHGAFFPPNPGSWSTSTIGGNVATNASGPRSYRYGSTRAWVREVELVLGDGSRTRWGSRARKRSVGPDLVSIFAGSEGTLGIATEITVRTAPTPAVRRGLVVELPDRAELGRLAIALATAAGTGLSAIEYLDRATTAELAGAEGARLGEGRSVLLLEVEADRSREADERVARIARLVSLAGASSAPHAYADADGLWTARGQANSALDRRFPDRMREDIAVPLGAIDALVREIERIAERAHVPLFLFGHLGDGSLHPNLVVAPGGAKAARIRAELLRAALRLGGTISGEHGIGATKPPFLEQEIGGPGLAVLRALKRECDPDGILNPGKLFPAPAARRSSPSPSAAGARGARPAAPNAGPDRRGPGRPRRPHPRRRAARR